MLGLLASTGTLARTHDVRVLIDVSGSMRQNDPRNLRVPALRLLADLLPVGDTAGVWLFDETVDALVAPAIVDAQWKTRARDATARIDSRGQFTNIEAALAAASADWRGAAPDAAERHVILLTDGMVDVAKDDARNATSRARVLGEELARLTSLGARIHTVALSAHADHELLKALAVATDGWTEAVADADSLQRSFLHMFEQAAAPDTLPLAGNRFTVDSSVRELTLLVFRHDEAPALELRDPAGAPVSANAHPDTVRWQHEAGYDLVTIAAPAAGEWRFNASEDPDNRAMIVTDLALKTAALPAHLMSGQPLAVAATLTEQGKPVSRTDFLQLLHGRLRTAGATGEPVAGDLALDPAKASFTGSVNGELPPGTYELTVLVDGGTFQRERRHRLEVHRAPFTFSHEVEAGPAQVRSIALTIAAEPEIVDTRSVSGLVIVSAPDGHQDVHEIGALRDGRLTLPIAAPATGDYFIQPWLSATTRAGRGLTLKPTPITVHFDHGATAPAAAPSIPAPSAPFAWGTVALVVGVGNVGLGAALGGVWWTLRRRPAPRKGVSL